MRFSICVALAGSACTNTGGDHSTVATRVVDACAELAAACSAGRDCLGHATFCGAIQSEIATFFTVEATCKAGCTTTTCNKDCKIQRVSGIDTVLAQVSIEGGAPGTGRRRIPIRTPAAARPSSCAPRPSRCPTPATASWSPARHCGRDHTCKFDCRQACLTCEAGSGSGTPDAGVAPDAPMTTTGFTRRRDQLLVAKIAGNHHNVLNVYPGFDTVAHDWVVKDNAAQ